MRLSSNILHTILAHRPEGRIAVLGDCILDCYVSGDTDRLSREAPIPILRHRNQRYKPGGAANVACNIAAMKFPVTLLGVTGQDREEADLRKTLSEYPDLSLAFVPDPNRRTTLKTRFISQAQQMFRIDQLDTDDISTATQNMLFQHLKDIIDDCTTLIFSDYGNGVLTPELLQKSIKLAKDRHVHTIVDPRKQDITAYRGVDFITPNLEELSKTSNQDLDPYSNDDHQVVMAARQMCKSAQAQAILATRGAKGLSLICPATEIHLPARAQQVFDVTGAGDCVIAWFALGLCSGLKSSEAAIAANMAGGLAVEELGAAVLDRNDMSRLAEAPGNGHRYKIQSVDSLPDLIAQWQKKEQRIGFTNGCFDIIHSGHISQLNFARNQCDVLIVALNSDDSIRQLKGPHRPVQTQQRRVEVMAALADVDIVVVFNESTPLALIEMLKPHVYIKGNDYDLDTLPEAKAVRSYGGLCLHAPLLPGVSTSKIIDEIRHSTKA